MTSNSDLSSLIEAIQSAFEGAKMPSDEELLHPDGMDEVDVLEFYGGVHWRDMTDDNVVYSYAAPTAFSPIAFRYYLPAYLIWTLNNADSKEYAGESILLALDPGTEKELLHDFRKSKFDLLTREQVKAVKAFLWYLEDHSDLGPLAQTALVNYWIDA